MDLTAKRNENSLKRLRLRENYAKLMKSLEVLLDEFRFNMSKTKSVVGFSLVDCGIIDMRDMEPNTWINTMSNSGENNDTFILSCTEDSNAKEPLSAGDLSEGLRKRLTVHDSNESTKTADKKQDCDQQKRPHSFRPFGVLEPLSAKQARQNIKSTLPLICDLANLQREICHLESQLSSQ